MKMFSLSGEALYSSRIDYDGMDDDGLYPFKNAAASVNHSYAAAKEIATEPGTNVAERRRAFLIRLLYKKFPHLFFKNKPHNPTNFFLSHSATLANMEEALRILKLSDSSTDLVAFKKCFSLFRCEVDQETRNIPNRLDESLFKKQKQSKNVHLKGDEEIIESKESVRFDFGNDYGSRREFAELGKELAFGYEWSSRISRRRESKDSKNIASAKDVYELSSQEEMLNEFF